MTTGRWGFSSASSVLQVGVIQQQQAMGSAGMTEQAYTAYYHRLLGEHGRLNLLACNLP